MLPLEENSLSANAGIDSKVQWLRFSNSEEMDLLLFASSRLCN